MICDGEETNDYLHNERQAVWFIPQISHRKPGRFTEIENQPGKLLKNENRVIILFTEGEKGSWLLISFEHDFFDDPGPEIRHDTGIVIGQFSVRTDELAFFPLGIRACVS